jgi:hypothetical protein
MHAPFASAPLVQALSPMVDTLFVMAIFACAGLAAFFHISGNYAWRIKAIWIGAGLVVLWLLLRTAFFSGTPSPPTKTQ